MSYGLTPVTPPPVVPPPTVPERLMSIDAFRGLVMLLMAAEMLFATPHVAEKVLETNPDSVVWKAVYEHTSHVAWEGMSLHDMIQPSFSFLVGVVVPFSIASRRVRGHSTRRMLLHAAWRSIALIFLGIWLRSIGKPMTYWTFEDTLTQIGLGYFFLFILGMSRAWWHWLALTAILAGYWYLWTLYPEGSPLLSPEHWQKNANMGWRFDVWFLNLFPRETEFKGNEGGYLTLSFIPTLGTMILGLIAGTWLRSGLPSLVKVLLFVLAGAAGIAGGYYLHEYDICPNVKRIWTPTWVLYSGGFCFAGLAFFYLVVDVIRFRAWAFPLAVFGMNSIAMYVLTEIEDKIHFFRSFLETHLDAGVFTVFGDVYAPMVKGTLVLIIFWLIFYWMYRNKVFVRI
jgi:heparan-alpha-glucosaminide N-acetyltransferase